MPPSTQQPTTETLVAHLPEPGHPLWQFISEPVLHALRHYLQTGNQTYKQEKLQACLHTLNWIPNWQAFDPVLNRFSENHVRQFKQDFDQYLAHQQAAQQHQQEKRRDYAERVQHYFKTTLSAQDKRLLETLRDYELNLTARDANFRHYFSFNSFKAIDTFATQRPEDREKIIEQFKTDVALYQHNLKQWQILLAKVNKNKDHATADLDFNSWCDAFEDWEPQPGRTSNQTGDATQTMTTDLKNAMITLALDNLEQVTLPTVKAQFRKLALQHHPDKAEGNHEKMLEIIQAFQTLKTHLTEDTP